MKQYFKRDVGSLDLIFKLLEDFQDQIKLNDKDSQEIELAIEEIFTNTVKYNKGDQNEILIELEKPNDSIIIKITDFNVDPFDPTCVPPFNASQKLEDRPIGGIGIHLVKKYMDDFKYEYKNRTSTITLTKKLGVKGV